MKLYLSKGRHWTGTQADAKAAQGGTDFETIEVPDPKPERIKWLNEQWAAMLDATAAQPETVTIATADMRADKDGEPSISHEVAVEPEETPTVRPAQMERFEALARKLGWTPPGTVVEKPVPSVEAIEEVLFEAQGNTLIRILSSAISRLGEVAGIHGWAAFTKNVYAWSPGAKNVEQGMGMLMLSAFNNFGAAEKLPTADKPSD